jgi:hypothetical protein
LLSLLLLVVVIAVVAGFFLLQGPAAQPLVLINSPRNGDRVAVGQETVIHAVARGEQKIKRVELWVDGKLQDAQTTNIAGGMTSFPLVANWRPPTPGAHTFIVRAFNVQGRQGQASINVEAVQGGDRDNDNVPDALDGCPDQPGLTTNNGCPIPTTSDRDGDGVPDSSDLCPGQAGTLLAQGCPDADGDGVADASDACPREVGTAERNGCPASGDGDGDGISDASDACPSEAGSAALGGCPDRDADGVRDSDDACPDAAGSSGTRGCPDRDGDGVYDTIDLCPEVAGPASNSGCPPTGSGDSDGDGVDNNTDLNPGEAGPADAGGSPPPGGGADGDGDGTADVEEPSEDPAGGLFGGLFLGPMYVMTTAEVQALEFKVEHDYSQVYCYASLASSAEERIGPFAPLGARRWDIANYLGPLHSRTLFVPSGQPLQVHVECSGIVAGSVQVPAPGEGIGEGGGEEAYFDLGSISRSHTVGTFTTVEETVDSSGGTAGHTFRVKYRVCTPACAAATLLAPMIRLTHVSSVNMLWWEWPGQTYEISGFKIYMNGNDMFSRPPRSTFYRFSGVPPCGQRFDIQMTAYRGNPSHPDAESPRSNVVTWEGAPCQRTVLVSFLRLETGDLGDNDDLGNVGPLFGAFYAGDEYRDFESHHRLDDDDTRHDISDFFPRTDFTVVLGPDEPLLIGALIKDRDPGRNPNDTIFDFEESLQPAQIQSGEHRLTGRFGSAVVVYINVTPGH